MHSQCFFFFYFLVQGCCLHELSSRLSSQLLSSCVQRSRLWVSLSPADEERNKEVCCVVCICAFQLGEAVTKNPGYLKLRRIRAAQNIAKTVRFELLTSSAFNGQHIATPCSGFSRARLIHGR